MIFAILIGSGAVSAAADDGGRPVGGKLVCVGASITQGALASRPELCYVSQIGALAARAHVALQVVNEGRSGWSTGAYAYNAAKLAERLPSDTTVITIMLGTNDTREKGTPAKIGAAAAVNLEKLIKAYRAKVPLARVVLITPTAQYPAKYTKHLRETGYDEAAPAKLVAIDAACAALSSRLGLQLIDVSDLPAIDDSPEGVHLNDAGHAKLAERIWRGLNAGPTTRSAPAAGGPMVRP